MAAAGVSGAEDRQRAAVGAVLRALALALAMGCSIGCSPAPLVARNVPDETRFTLRELARDQATPPCGSCHIPPGKPAAIAVFDLTELDWAGRMSPAQFPTFLQRLGSDNPARPSPVRQYLEAEAARRQATPTP